MILSENKILLKKSTTPQKVAGLILPQKRENLITDYAIVLLPKQIDDQFQSLKIGDIVFMHRMVGTDWLSPDGYLYKFVNAKDIFAYVHQDKK